MIVFRGCWSCGSLDVAVSYCTDCQVNICEAGHCQHVHGLVHADVLWHRRIDAWVESRHTPTPEG
jgi:hypothetical protein